jgi:hypothetical protein
LLPAQVLSALEVTGALTQQTTLGCSSTVNTPTAQSLMTNHVSLSIFRSVPSLVETSANMGFLEPIEQLIYDHIGFNQFWTYESIISQSANAGHS